MRLTKKGALILALVLAIAALGAGGSLAYFVTAGQAQNTITSGNVQVELQEFTETEDGLVPFEDVEGIMPGDEISKIVQAANTGANPAWVRISTDTVITGRDGSELANDVVSFDYNTDNWTIADDGYAYYNSALLPGQTTEPLFTTVTFARRMGNEYFRFNADVIVDMEAVQTANNGTSALNAAGWPAAE